MESVEIVVRCVQMNERGEEIAGDDLRESFCVFIFFQDDLLVE